MTTSSTRGRAGGEGLYQGSAGLAAARSQVCVHGKFRVSFASDSFTQLPLSPPTQFNFYSKVFHTLFAFRGSGRWLQTAAASAGRAATGEALDHI